ncbi:14578_t:CDS:2, partial [Cetraspora pellucida]
MSLYTISAFGDGKDDHYIYIFSGIGFECPEKSDDNPNELYANPNDCGSFYQCSYNTPYLNDCPDDLQWNSKILACDWPENSDCGVESGGDHSQGNEGDNSQGDEHQGDDNQGDEHQGDDHQGDEHQGDDNQGDEHQGDDSQGDNSQGDDSQDDKQGE